MGHTVYRHTGKVLVLGSKFNSNYYINIYSICLILGQKDCILMTTCI